MTRARTNADQAHTESVESIPHIIPGVLYPAVADKMVDGTTSLSASTTGPNSSTVTSSKYGTVQSDGRMYYYTDIKGSKPIKDPRIGAHFGSQRYKFKSLQLLEQETATHGSNIYSVDGRENIRFIGSWTVSNASSGVNINGTSSSFMFEVTGYFNDINLLESHRGGSTRGRWVVNVDGASAVITQTSNAVTPDTPLQGRYVDDLALRNFAIGSTLGIHTVKFTVNGDNNWVGGCELIAQDTSSTANKSKIQIPSQNVVSYGKKFTVSGTPHYDPFNGFTNDTTLFSSVVDVATSLGLGTATTWGAPWDKGSDDHIRPFNGGRVVKWVDSSGTIKTSVTMMPANAQNITTTASNEITTASATNSHTINFSDDAVENSLSEVAKTFHWREFGNGAANGGTGATWADASMYSAADNIAYVMDDGLTSLSGDINVHNSGYGISVDAASKYFYITFIGTGISWKTGGAANNPNAIWAQNLPYGTHILKFITDGSNVWDGNVYLDGVDIKNDFASGSNRENYKWSALDDITFYQPKKPPIPEEAVVIADYMLMADTVSASGSVDILSHISKGVRRISCSRDFFYDASSGTPTVTLNVGYPSGILQSHGGSINGGICRLPYFGTNYQPISMSSKYSTVDKGGSTDVTVTEVGSTAPLLLTSSAHTLGQYDGQTDRTTSGDFFNFGAEIATPTHTSSHYQTFETPYLHELVGGDRNMEQNNLVVTPDGKTWDEVTRDTSYIGSICVRTNTDTQSTGDTTEQRFDEWRGEVANGPSYMNKDFAIAYGRLICLKAGQYACSIKTKHQGNNNGWYMGLYVNDVRRTVNINNDSATSSSTEDSMFSSTILQLNRGDVVRVAGRWYNSLITGYFQINRV